MHEPAASGAGQVKRAEENNPEFRRAGTAATNYVVQWGDLSILPRIKYGQTVGVSCDGCQAGLTAKVSFIARTAEYTPPVIYSLEERAKLVYLIEARPDEPEKFRVGQPVTITLPKEPPK